MAVKETAHRKGEIASKSRSYKPKKPKNSSLEEQSQVTDSGRYSSRSVLQMQSRVGNRAVQHLLAAHVEGAGFEQRDNNPLLQRDETNPEGASKSATAGSKSTTVVFGPFTLKTFAQLASAGRVALGEMEKDLKNVEPESDLHQRTSDWIAWIKWWLPYLDKQGEQPLTPEAAAKASTYLDEAGTLRKEIKAKVDKAQKAEVVRELRRAKQQADDAAAAAERLRPVFENQLRSAFRADKESLIKEWADRIGTATDIGMGLHELSRQMAESVAGAVGTELPAVSKLTEALDFFNKGLAALNLFFIVTDNEKKTTELEEGMRQINNASGAFAAFSTLGSLAPHIGLYANLYLVPMTKAIMAQISRLTEMLHNANIDWAAFSGNIMYPGAEPGGQEMFDFMTTVMHAGSAEEVPEIQGKVKSFLFEHREALEAGTKEEVPTTGWWFWRKINTTEARDWVFGNRQMVWAMFYGSMKVPEPRRK